jgi:hypothetical protein
MEELEREADIETLRLKLPTVAIPTPDSMALVVAGQQLSETLREVPTILLDAALLKRDVDKCFSAQGRETTELTDEHAQLTKAEGTVAHYNAQVLAEATERGRKERVVTTATEQIKALAGESMVASSARIRDMDGWVATREAGTVQRDMIIAMEAARTSNLNKARQRQIRRGKVLVDRLAAQQQEALFIVPTAIRAKYQHEREQDTALIATVRKDTDNALADLKAQHSNWIVQVEDCTEALAAARLDMRRLRASAHLLSYLGEAQGFTQLSEFARTYLPLKVRHCAACGEVIFGFVCLLCGPYFCLHAKFLLHYLLILRASRLFVSFLWICFLHSSLFPPTQERGNRAHQQWRQR